MSNEKKLGDFGFDGKDVADLYYYPHKAEYVYTMLDTAIEEIIDSLCDEFSDLGDA